MPLFEIHVHNHVDTDTIHQHLHTIINNQTKIMGQLDDLKTEVANLKGDVAALQTSLDAEQAAIQQLLDSNAAVVTGLNQQIATLESQLANAVDPTALQTVIDDIKSTRDSIATTKADLEGTVPDAPQG